MGPFIAITLPKENPASADQRANPARVRLTDRLGGNVGMKIWRSDFLTVRLPYAGAASITIISDGVGTIRVSLKPAASRRVRYSTSVRSRPPVITSMLRSMNL